MRASPDIVGYALPFCFLISVIYPLMKGLSEGILFWVWTYPKHLLRLSRRRNSKYFLLISIRTSILGALYNTIRSIKFRTILMISRDSVATNRDNLIRLEQVSGSQHGNLIVVIPGTWFDSKETQRSPLSILLEKIKTDHPDCRIFLAPWFAVNNHEVRKQVANQLADLIGKKMHDGEVASLIGHSHGGTVAAMAAALLPHEKIHSVVTIGTPFIKQLDADVLNRRTGSLALEAALLSILGFAFISYYLEKLIRGYFEQVGFWSPSMYSLRLLVFILFGSVLFAGWAFTMVTRSPEKYTLARPHKYYSGSRFTAIIAIER